MRNRFPSHLPRGIECIRSNQAHLALLRCPHHRHERNRPAMAFLLRRHRAILRVGQAQARIAPGIYRPVPARAPLILHTVKLGTLRPWDHMQPRVAAHCFQPIPAPKLHDMISRVQVTRLFPMRRDKWAYQSPRPVGKMSIK